MKMFLATAAVLATTATAAVAGNVAPLPMDPVVPAPAVTDWSGFYLGATGGWMTGDADPLVTDITNVVTGFEFDGLAYGGFVGYNYQFDSGLVLGGELAAYVGEMTMDDVDDDTFDATVLDLKARVGFAADRALIYGFGGYSVGTYDDGIAALDAAGFVVGGGVDFLVTDKIFVGAEYAYRDLEDSENDPAQWEGTASTITARVGLKF